MADNEVLIDWEQMDMIADGYTPDFVDIFREFAAEIPVLLGQLEGLAGQGDCEAIARLAHQIKGSSANFGFKQLSGAAAEIESRAKGGSAEGLEGLLERARTGFGNALAELRTQRGLAV